MSEEPYIISDRKPCCDQVYNRTHNVIEKFVDPTKGEKGSLYLAFICGNCGTIMQGWACKADSKESIYSRLREIHFVTLDLSADIKPVAFTKAEQLKRFKVSGGSMLPVAPKKPRFQFLKAKYFTLLDTAVVLSCVYYIA